MSGLIRAEFRKVLTTKLWWGMLLGSMALAALGVIGQIASNGTSGNDTPGLDTTQTQQSVFSSAGAAGIFIMIVGIIGITTEYRHFTSRPTFLIEPRRGRVIVAKLLVFAVVGIVYSLVCVAEAIAIAVPWLSLKNVSVGWESKQIIAVLALTALGVAIYALVGVGIGVLIHNQIAAVIGSLAYFLVIENLISIIPGVKVIHKFLPGATANAITDLGHYNHDLLRWWQGAILLIAWGLFFAVLGWVLTVRSDVP